MEKLEALYNEKAFCDLEWKLKKIEDEIAICNRTYERVSNSIETDIISREF